MNNQVERANRTILQLLSISPKDQRYWDVQIRDVKRHFNKAVNKTTSKTSFEVLHGYQPHFGGGLLHMLSKTKNE